MHKTVVHSGEGITLIYPSLSLFPLLQSIPAYMIHDSTRNWWRNHGPLASYVKSQVAHAPGMPGTISSPSTSKETASGQSRHTSRHVFDACAVMHVGIVSLRWLGKRCWHSRRICASLGLNVLRAGAWAISPTVSIAIYNTFHRYIHSYAMPGIVWIHFGP